MMRTLDSVDLGEKRVLIRVDFNVPLGDDGTITDDTRIKAALPTLRRVLGRNGACVLITHLGRPGGKPVERLRLDTVAERLSSLLPDHPVRKCDEVVGERATEMARALKPGELLLLENLRFEPGETAADAGFAAELAGLADVYVNEAFSASHRKHASVYVAPQRFPPEARAVGLLFQREIEALGRALERPEHPFVAVFGGAKVSDKLDAVGALLDRSDRILIGGAMSYTIMKARAQTVGDSIVEHELVGHAAELSARAGDKLLLPTDHVVSGDAAEARIVSQIPEGTAAFDIGPDTIARYRNEIGRAKTILWNGPMGKIEDEAFLDGTRALAQAIGATDAVSVVGGGETGEAVRRLGLEDELTHVSTGGGAFLHYVAHRTLPGLEVVDGE